MNYIINYIIIYKNYIIIYKISLKNLRFKLLAINYINY